MPGACWGRAEQGWTSGGALQDGQGRVGRAWHVVTASRTNRPTTRVELSVRHGPFPLCTLHTALCTLHSASLVTTCPQPSPTAGPVVPTPWIVCRFRICSLCLALAGQPGPQSGHSFPGYLGSAAVRPCSNWSSHLPSARPQRRRPDKRQHCLDRCATGRRPAGTRSAQSSQSLGYHSCTSCRSWAPSSRYAAALSAVGHARHWPTSRSCRCVRFWPGPACLDSVRLCHSPAPVLNISTTARRGAPKAPKPRARSQQHEEYSRHRLLPTMISSPSHVRPSYAMGSRQRGPLLE